MEEKQNTINNSPSYVSGRLKTTECLVSQDLKDDNKMTVNSGANASLSSER